MVTQCREGAVARGDMSGGRMTDAPAPGKRSAKSRPLTKRQAAVLEFIRDYTAREDRPPTLREIGARFRLASLTGVRQHLTAMEKKGYIEQRRRTPRGIRLTAESRVARGVPIVRRVAPCTAITATVNLDGHLSLDALALHRDGVFALRVLGDSMIDAGIMDGDYVVVQEKPTFEDGEIGVAILDDKAIVQRLRRAKGEIRLEPANKRLGPWFVDPEQYPFRYGGKVIAVHRVMEDKPASV